MFRFLFKRFAGDPLSKPTIPTFYHLYLIKFSSVSEKNTKKDSSFTISYLVSSCGLTPQSASSVSDKINIINTENPDSVIKVLKSYKFTTTQIAKLITNMPSILLANPEKVIKPKFDFILSLGFSQSQFQNFMPSCTHLLRRSLANRLKVNVQMLETVYESKDQLGYAIRRNCRLLASDLERYYLPNVEILKRYGIPCSMIAKLASLNPRAMMQPSSRFEEMIKVIKSLGFDPSSAMFVRGVIVMLELKPSSWEKKVNVYKSVGWSKEDVIAAFVRQPNCMLISEEKIKQSMEFFVKKIKWQPSFLVKNPVYLKMSLPKRVIPRCLVIDLLAKKELVRKPSPSSFLIINNQEFLKKYVTKYQDELPEVLQAYNVKENSCFLRQPPAMLFT